MEPQVRYAQTADDVSIAYWTYGDGPVLVETPLVPFSHIEMEWQNPHIRRWYERLGQMVTVVRYDGRGTGLSQRGVSDVSLEAHVHDLEAVVERVGPEPVALMGVFHSGPGAIAYAARNPGRVSHLLLWCTYVSGADYWRMAQAEGLRALRQTDYLLFLRTAAHELIGWAEDGQSDLFAEIMERSVEPDEADRLIAATRDFDVTGSLSDVVSPTLVLHRRDLDWLDVSLSRSLASSITDARLVVIAGRSPLPAAGEIEAGGRAVADFLGLDLPPLESGLTGGAIRVVLFTDRSHQRVTEFLQAVREREGDNFQAAGIFSIYDYRSILGHLNGPAFDDDCTFLAVHQITFSGDQLLVLIEMEAAAAGKTFSLGRVDTEKAVGIGQGEVELLTRLLQAPLAHVFAHVGYGHVECAHAGIRRQVLVMGEYLLI